MLCIYRYYIKYLIPNCFNFFQSIKKPFFCCFPSKIEEKKVVGYSKLGSIKKNLNLSSNTKMK